MEENMINKIKKYSAIGTVAGALFFGVYMSSSVEYNNKLKYEKEQIEHVQWKNRMDSLQNIDELVSRLDGFDATAAWLGGFDFKKSLEDKYKKEYSLRNDTVPKIMVVSFEDYLSGLYCEQQYNKLNSLKE
ncbi:MAG: hypothetical protein WC758_02500 [Candidatus Woesearchaeota archaeon]|jgi:hypothetical protein